MKRLSTRHLIGIKNITENDIQLLFETADNFKEVINRPIKKVPSLRDITVANLFFESSTRTRVSFELAERRLSADIVNFTASVSLPPTPSCPRPISAGSLCKNTQNEEKAHRNG
jgi:aspartate carbamoyltransferase catalytic subunit